MNAILASFIGGWEMVLIMAVVLVLFGAKKLPDLAKGLGQGIKEFKKATREVQDEITSGIEDHPSPRRHTSPRTEPPHTLEPAQSGSSLAPPATTTAAKGLAGTADQ